MLEALLDGSVIKIFYTVFKRLLHIKKNKRNFLKGKTEVLVVVVEAPLILPLFKITSKRLLKKRKRKRKKATLLVFATVQPTMANVICGKKLTHFLEGAIPQCGMVSFL